MSPFNHHALAVAGGIVVATASCLVYLNYRASWGSGECKAVHGDGDSKSRQQSPSQCGHDNAVTSPLSASTLSSSDFAAKNALTYPIPRRTDRSADAQPESANDGVAETMSDSKAQERIAHCFQGITAKLRRVADEAKFLPEAYSHLNVFRIFGELKCAQLLAESIAYEFCFEGGLAEVRSVWLRVEDCRLDDISATDTYLQACDELSKLLDEELQIDISTLLSQDLALSDLSMLLKQEINNQISTKPETFDELHSDEATKKTYSLMSIASIHKLVSLFQAFLTSDEVLAQTTHKQSHYNAMPLESDRLSKLVSFARKVQETFVLRITDDSKS